MKTRIRFSVFKILSSILLLVNSAEVDLDLSVDRTGWVDPTDPLSQPIPNYASQMVECDCDEIQRGLREENTRLREQLYAVQLVRENSVDVLMKHVLHQFLIKLNIDLDNIDKEQSIFKKAQISLSNEDLAIIRKYLRSQRQSEEIALREGLRASLENFIIETDIRSDNSLLSFLHSLLPYMLFLNVLLLLPAAFIVIRWVCSISRLCLIMLVIAFGLSCYFTYIRKYQEVLALRFERSERQGVHGKSPCSPQGLVSEAFDLMLSYVTIKDKSECLKSYEDMLIEPFLLVDPLQVFAEVMSNFFLTPFSVAGLHLNRFFKQFFANTPIHLALLMTLFLCLMPVLLVWAGLKIWEHLNREKRKNDEHQREMLKGQQSQKQIAGPAESGSSSLGEKERTMRRRALGGQQKTTTAAERRLSAHSSAASDNDSDSSLRRIRQRIDERRKWK